MTSIPAEAVQRLRESLYGQLGYIAEELASAARTPGHEINDEWSEPVARFDRTRALLDQISWNERNPEPDVEIDLDQHRQVILAALNDHLAIEHYLMSEEGDHAAGQRRRAHARALTIETFMAAAGLEAE
jgi:hypothetical protein